MNAKNFGDVVALATALGPFVPGAVATVAQVVGALKGVGILTGVEVDADLRALIVEALAAKAEADRAARGEDVR